VDGMGLGRQMDFKLPNGPPGESTVHDSSPGTNLQPMTQIELQKKGDL
jgi:hypothetical protein